VLNEACYEPQGMFRVALGLKSLPTYAIRDLECIQTVNHSSTTAPVL